MLIDQVLKELSDMIRVLLVDDHESFVSRMKKLFEKHSEIIVVGAASNGKEAVRLARKLLPDIVLMDISMPEMNGIDATRQLKKSISRTKVLCLTVHSEKHFVSAMLRAGAAGYILKDCPFDELKRAISTVQSGQRYVSPQVAQYVNSNLLQTSSNNHEPGR